MARWAFAGRLGLQLARIAIAVVGGCLVWGGIVAARALGAGVAWIAAVCDMAALPGAVMLFPLFPEGPHTGQGVLSWAMMLSVANVIFYSTIVYLGLRARGWGAS